MIKKAVIPAAGLGTRFLPATKAQPKEMLPIVDKPAIQYIVEEAISSGIEDIIIVTGRNKRAIEDHFDRSLELDLKLREKNDTDLLKIVDDLSNLVDIHYIRQKEPLGLGHAVYCARKFIGNEPFAVLLGDDLVHSDKPCLQQLIEVYNQQEKSVIGVQRVDWKETRKYGIVTPGMQEGTQTEVVDLVEKPKANPPSNLAVMGRYILHPSVFAYLEKTEPGANGEIQLTDALRLLAQDQGMVALEFEGRRYDIGDKLGFLEATVDFALMRDDLRDGLLQHLQSITSVSKSSV